MMFHKRKLWERFEGLRLGLTVIFIPEASQYDKSPYKWKLASFVDEQSDTPIAAEGALARFPQTG